MTATDKSYVVVRFPDGRYRAWAHYGDVAWGSPAYTVLTYVRTHREARDYINGHRENCACDRHTSGQCGWCQIHDRENPIWSAAS